MTAHRTALPSRLTSGRAARRSSIRDRRATWLGLGLVAPSFLVIVVLVLVPSAQSVVGSFLRYELTSSDHAFTGITNYLRILGDADFQQALVNTAGYFVIITVGMLLFGMAMALWLQSLHGARRAAALTVIVLPWAVPGTVAGVLWSFILNPTGTGLLNSVLKSSGVISTYQTWLNDPGIGPILIGLTVVWSSTPLAVVILLAGLEGIPTELYEASIIDGSGRVRQFLFITLPLIRPALAIVLVNGVVLSIGLFDQVFVLVGLDPSRTTIAGQMYLYAFRDFNFGFGFAASVFATALTAAVSVAYLKLVYREEEY